MSKLHVKKGDMVYINAGNNKGKKGRVTKIFANKKRALVEGVNIISKSIKSSAKNPQGGFEKKESSIHISNLNIVDPKNEKPVRISRKLDEKEGLVRYSRKSGYEIK